MDYKKIYEQFIDSRKKMNRSKNDGVDYDLHHILPRSLGGTDEEDNLILLTYKEHFIAHEMLAKIYPGREMKGALFIMMNNTSNHPDICKTFSPSKYEKIKTNYINALKKKTVCLETGIVYNSREEANKAAGLVKFSADIVHCLDSDTKTAGGFHWGTYDENTDYSQNKWFGKEKQEKYVIIRLEDLKKYTSWKSAANDIGATTGAIGYSVSTIGGSAKGYHFAKYNPEEDYSNNIYITKQDNLKIKKSERLIKEPKKIKKIQCIETGEVFNCQADALRKYNVKSSGGICVAIKKGRKCAGLHWRYIDENN